MIQGHLNLTRFVVGNNYCGLAGRDYRIIRIRRSIGGGDRGVDRNRSSAADRIVSMSESEKKKVVVVGGGIAGSKIAKDLEDVVDVTLIDPYVLSFCCRLLLCA